MTTSKARPKAHAVDDALVEAVMQRVADLIEPFARIEASRESVPPLLAALEQAIKDALATARREALADAAVVT